MRSVRSIARTTAPGQRGCSEKNASAMKTNGIADRPNAINGPPGGAFGLRRDRDEARQQRPVGRHQRERRDRIARHFSRGGSGSVPASGDRRTRSATLSSLHRARREPADEVLLEREEHDRRERHRDEGGGREQVPVLAPLADEARAGRR